MADKALTESAWKAFSKSGDYKDAAFVKALAALDKAGKSGAQAELDALDEIDKQAEALRKAHKADKKLGDYLDDVEKALGKQRKASEEALAAERKAAASSSSDDEEESPALLTSKMVPLIREVKKGGIVLQSLIAVAGKETVVLLSRKAISPARGKLLKEQMEKPAGLKFIRGECTLENNAITFIVQGQAAGLAKRLKAALLEQVEQRLKIRVRGEDPNDIDEDAEEDDNAAGGTTQDSTADDPDDTPAPTPDPSLQTRFEGRLAKIEPLIAEVLKAQRGDVSKIRAIAAFAREKGKERLWEAGLQSLDMLDKLLAAAAGGGTETPPPTETPSTGVEPGAAFNARLAALMPKVKEALAAGGESATDVKLKVSEAGVFARKREFDKAQALLDDVEALLEQGAQGSGPKNDPDEDPKAAAYRALVARLQPQIDRASKGGLAPAQQEALQKVQAAWNLARESADAGNFERGLLILQRLEAGGVLAGLVGAPGGGTAGGGDTPTPDGRGRIVRQRTFMIQEWSKVPGELRTRLQGLRSILIDSGADEDPDELVDAIESELEDLLESIRDEMDDAINAGEPDRFAGLRQRMNTHPLMVHLAQAPDFDGGAMRSAVDAALDRIERGMLAN
jgi:hypothetical protein